MPLNQTASVFGTQYELVVLFEVICPSPYAHLNHVADTGKMSHDWRDEHDIAFGHGRALRALFATVQSHSLVFGQKAWLETVPTDEAGQGWGFWAQVDVVVFADFDLKSLVNIEFVVVDMNLRGHNDQPQSLHIGRRIYTRVSKAFANAIQTSSYPYVHAEK